MKKRIVMIFVCGMLILGIIWCKEGQSPNHSNLPEKYDQRFVQCLESELGAYLVTEADELVEIPLQEITNYEEASFAYYKGVYASNHPDNRYVIVFPEQGTYHSSVMKDFDKYFYERFSVYQRGDVLSVSIYVHNSQHDINFQDIVQKCVKVDSMDDGKSIPSDVLKKLDSTTKIVMKTEQQELGVIDNQEKISEILRAVSSSKLYGDVFLCDGSAFTFEMYDKENQLIDVISLWADGKRLMISDSHPGCSYYSVSNDIDFRKIIETESDYIFYSILDYRDRDSGTPFFLYEKYPYRYFIRSNHPDEILIEFLINHQTMTLSYALEHQYISAEKVANEYPDILITQMIR